MASLVKRGNTWYVAWRDGRRQRRKSLETPHRREAERRLDIWQRNRAQKRWSLDIRRDCTPAQFWTAFLPWLHAHLAPQSVEAKASHWRRFLREFAPQRLGHVGKNHVERLKARWEREGRNGSSVNSFLREMRSIYNYARELALGPDGPMFNGENPFAQVRHVRVQRQVKDTLSTEQVDLLVRAAVEHSKTPQAHDIHLPMALLAYAGLRKNEVISARWEWFDWETRTLTIKQGAAFTTKSGKFRTLPFAKKLEAVLRPHRRDSGYLFMPECEPKPGQRYRCDFRRSFQFVAAKAGFPKLTIHTLRHSWITNLIRAGVNVVKVSQWAGHSSIAITADVYSHLQGFDDDIDRL